MRAVHMANYRPSLTKPYDPVEARRSYVVKYNKGDIVHELFHGSIAYIMIIRTSHSTSGPALPDGWTSKERTLSSDLHVYTPDHSTILLDDLNNIYTSRDECRFHV